MLISQEKNWQFVNFQFDLSICNLLSKKKKYYQRKKNVNLQFVNMLFQKQKKNCKKNLNLQFVNNQFVNLQFAVFFKKSLFQKVFF